MKHYNHSQRSDLAPPSMASDMKKKIWRLFQCTGTDGSTSDKVNNNAPKRIIFKGSYENFLRNGGVLLEERISLFHGKTNPIRCLSVEDLNTGFEDWTAWFSHDFSGHWYGCVWEGRPVSVKLWLKHKVHTTHYDYGLLDMYCREIVIATQMGIHENVHKLLACCLETEYPVLIYESVKVGSLLNRILGGNDNEPPLGWKDRLRISWEISHVVAYLHSAFPRAIVHRDLTPINVLLDQHDAAKLADFSLSVLIPEGKTSLEIEHVAGTHGYLAPEYAMHGIVMEKSDVYSFGVLLLELVTGLRYSSWTTRLSHLEAEYYFDCESPDSTAVPVTECSDNLSNSMGISATGFSNIVQRYKPFKEILREFMEGNINGVVSGYTEEGDLFHQQLQASIDLALRCMEEHESRPTVEEVAIELKNMVASYAFI